MVINRSFKYEATFAFNKTYNQVEALYQQITSFVPNDTSDLLLTTYVDMVRAEASSIHAHVDAMRDHVNGDIATLNDSHAVFIYRIDSPDNIPAPDATGRAHLDAIMTQYRLAYLALVRDYESIYQPFAKPLLIPPHWRKRIAAVVAILVVFVAGVRFVPEIDAEILRSMYERGQEQLDAEEYESAVGAFSYTHFREYRDSRQYLTESYLGTIEGYLDADDPANARRIAIDFVNQDIAGDIALNRLSTTYELHARSIANSDSPDWDTVESLMLELENRPDINSLTNSQNDLLKRSYVERARVIFSDQGNAERYDLVRTVLEPMIARRPHDTTSARDGLDLLYQTYYEPAVALFDNANYPEARAQFDVLFSKIVEIEGGSRNTVDFEFGQQDSARYMYRETYYIPATEAFANDQYTEARDLLEPLWDEARRSSPHRDVVPLYLETYYEPGEIAFSNDDFDIAIDMLEPVHRYDQDYRDVEALLSRAYYQSATIALDLSVASEDERVVQLDKAIDLLESLQSIDSNYRDSLSRLLQLYYELGVIYNTRNDWDAAKDIWLKLHRLNPSYADAETQYRLSYYYPAAQVLSNAKASIPSGTDVSLADAELEQIASSCEDSRDVFEMSSPISLTGFRDTQTLVSDAIYCEVQIALLLNDLERALSAVEELNTLSPYYLATPSIYNETLYALGAEQLAAGDWDNARENLGNLLDREPFYLDAGTLYREAYYRPALQEFNAQSWDATRTHLLPLLYGDSDNALEPIDPAYKNAATMFRETYYIPAVAAFDSGQLSQARDLLSPLVNGDARLDLPPIDPTYRDTQRILRETYYIPAVAAYEASDWETARSEISDLYDLISEFEDKSPSEINYGTPPLDIRTMILESYYVPATQQLAAQDYGSARSAARTLIDVLVELSDDPQITTANANYGDSPTIREVLYDTYFNRAEDSMTQMDWADAREKFLNLISVIAGNERIPEADVTYRNVQTMVLNTYYLPASNALANGDWDVVRRESEALIEYLADTQGLSEDEVNFGDSSSGQDIQTIYRESYYIPGAAALQVGNWREARQHLSSLIELSPDYKDSQDLFTRSYLDPAQQAIAAENWASARDHLIEWFDISGMPGIQASGSLLVNAHITPAERAFASEDWQTVRDNLLPIIYPEQLSGRGEYADIYEMLQTTISPENMNAYEELHRQSLSNPVVNLIDTGNNQAARAALFTYSRLHGRDQTYEELLLSSYNAPFETAVNAEDWVTASALYDELINYDLSDDTLGLILVGNTGLKSQLASDYMPYFLQISGSDWSRVDDTFGYAVNDIAVGTDGSQYAVGTSDGLLMNRSSITHTLSYLFKTPYGRIRDVVLSPGGDWLGAVSEDGKFRRWQLLIGREIVSPVTDGMMLSTAAVMASDNIVTGSANGQVIVWAWADSAYQNRSQFNFSSEITKIVVSSDDTFMLVAEANGMVHHVDLTTDTTTVSVNFGSHVYDIVLSSDETQFLVAGQQNEIVVWDMAGAEISRIGAHNDWVRSMTFSADGRYLFSVSDDQTLSIWDMVSNAPAHRASLDIRPRSVMIAPDSRSLVIGGAQNNSSTGVLMTWEWQN